MAKRPVPGKWRVLDGGRLITPEGWTLYRGERLSSESARTAAEASLVLGYSYLYAPVDLTADPPRLAEELGLVSISGASGNTAAVYSDGTHSILVIESYH